ncbi:MAG: hypothetical protein HC767_15035 [Akkermansiaceae bacterium]|nr:hypothetical protein [Akkermansiaceae bacterium]
MHFLGGVAECCCTCRENKAATEQVTATKSALEAAKGAHAIAVLTEWDEFKTLDWKAVLGGMQRPAFVFDGRKKRVGFLQSSVDRFVRTPRADRGRPDPEFRQGGLRAQPAEPDERRKRERKGTRKGKRKRKKGHFLAL